jgi:sugar phosphate isomerase/epimerase
LKIGLRIPGSAREMPFPEFCAWCRDNGFDGIDVGAVTPEVRQAVDAAGLEIGTADLSTLNGLCGSDADAEAAVAASQTLIDTATAQGVARLFSVIIPPDPARGRAANFARLRETLGPVVRHAETRGARIAIEGWPGPAPHYGALGVTPETLRALFDAFPSPALGLNYDPSHLIRIGVDYLRFLCEFGRRIIHCHGKDTAFDAESLYLYGSLGPTFATPKPFGEEWWRYAIPGEGVADWGAICARLGALGYAGFISVELEDYRYHLSWEAESRGLLRAREHLARYA